MRCPRCDQLWHHLDEPCPYCHLTGDSALLEELAHVRWIADEIARWPHIALEAQLALRQSYLDRRRELEIQLKLRLPRFTAEQAAQAWPELSRQEELHHRLTGWLRHQWLNPAATAELVTQTRQQVLDLREQLEGHARPAPTDAADLALTNFLLQVADGLGPEAFATTEAEQQIRASLLDQKQRLEVRLGLGPPLTLAPPAPVAAPERAPRTGASGRKPPPSPPEAPPLPWRDRLWRTLLSERTLQALLFLGIFLLFSAAISFVVWGWKDFSAPLRVTIPCAFTATFFGLGWFVRNRTHLLRSGIALSAIAALLIPIDFYAVYVNFEISSGDRPLFWFITSVMCLLAYILITLLIQNQLFGYLVGAAAGSVVLAGVELGHQAWSLSLDWRSTSISLLALSLIFGTTPFRRRNNPPGAPAQPQRIFSEPLRALSLLTLGALMPLTFGWRYVDRTTYDTLHTAMTVTWWAGSLAFVWGAIQYRSRSLALLAAIALPVAVYMTQAALFNRAGVNLAWHAFGLAWLVPLYFVAGRAGLARKDDPVLHSHGRVAVVSGVALLVVAAFWSLTDLRNGTAAACSHAVLTGAILLAARLWRRPSYLYAASLFSFTTVTFAMTTLDLTLVQMSLGWGSLAIAHILVALRVRGWPSRPIVVAGYVVAGLATLSPLVLYNGDLLLYTLGNWLGLTAWGARLAHQGQPGFSSGRASRQAVFHWLTALPLPFWIWLVFANRGPLTADLPLALVALAWGMLAFSYWLGGIDRQPWYLGGLAVSLAAPVAAFIIAPDGFAPALCLLGVGLLYLADAATNRQRLEWTPAGLVTAWGLALLLRQIHLSADGVSFALTLLVAAYFAAGLRAERRRSAVFTHHFLRPLYLAAHLISLAICCRIYLHPLNSLVASVPWTDAMKWWAAAIQVMLGGTYAVYAWATYRERWAYLATWLVAAGGGILALAFSQGQGSSATKVALGVIAFVLAERSLHWLHARQTLSRRLRAYLRLMWGLYQRPLLVTGWLASAGVIGLALIRNLWLLGGGRTQQIWAATGLLLMTGLYALSARLFRRARFVWLATLLSFVPWTILTNLGWFTRLRPSLAGFGVWWAILGWLLFLLSLGVKRLAPPPYWAPLGAMAHFLVPFSLVWAVADAEASRYAVGLAIGFYGLAAILDIRRARGEPRLVFRQTRFLYPALGLVPVWVVYLLSWLWPMARHEHYGLALLVFGPLGLAAGRYLRRFAPAPGAARGYALPAYLTGYTAVTIGTLLVAHIAPLLAGVLVFDALLALASAGLFRQPLWVYLAASLMPLSLLLALNEAGVPGDRRGWWLIGLAAVYLALAWLLRRARLAAYQAAVLTAGFALIALGLPPSSQDKIGAFWGYGAAALLYAVTAFWLRQPLLLTPACALALVPYAVGLSLSALRREYYGLALLPGAVIALALGRWLDARRETWRGFPWGQAAQWARAAAERCLGWWGLPLYALGLGLAAASPWFTHFKPGLSALNALLVVPIFAWAAYRFQLRGWLLAAGLAGHAAAWWGLDALGWWSYPSYGWLYFMPITMLTAGLAVFIERRRKEGSPLDRARWWAGWSRPLYALVVGDVILAQWASLVNRSEPAAWVSLMHALLVGCLATLWLSRKLPYVSASLGAVALLQWMATTACPFAALPVVFARLALAYGLVGFGLALPLAHRLGDPGKVWALPLQRAGLTMSVGILIVTVWRGNDIGAWTVRALLGFPFRQIVAMPTVQMVVGVLSLLGLLYVAAAFTYHRARLGYVAVGMLLAAWMLHAFYVQQWDQAAHVQWYALPAGVYLLGMAYLEWQRDNKTLARWLDYAAMLLMLGSLFWQTLLFGWQYALLLGAEGFAKFWWGSARRLRRFFYAGMLGVILATVAQLINSLQSINQWIVMGIIGSLVIVVGLLVERKREEIKAWLVVLETWE